MRRNDIILGHDLDALLHEEDDKIKQLKAALGDELIATDILTAIDEIYLLRFILSSNSLEEAENNVRENIKWRVEHYETLKRIHEGGDAPMHDEIIRFQVAGFSGIADAGHPIFVVRAGYCNVRSLMKSISQEDVTLWLHFTSEKSFKICDETTRKTRKLTKLISVLDCDSVSLFGENSDNKFFKCLGESSHLNTKHYPQLLGKSVFVNTPRLFNSVFKVIKVFMSKSALEKNGFCPAKNTKTGDASQCPFVKRIGGINAFPQFLGGQSECPHALKTFEEKGKQSSVSIKANSTSSYEIEVPAANAKLKFEILVKSHSIKLNATMKGENNDPNVPREISSEVISSKSGLVNGEWTIPEKGTLVIDMINTSRTKSKTVEFDFSLESDGE